jgi:hypothetical protein
MRLSRPHAGPHHQVRAERWTRLVRAASRRRGGHRRPRRVRRPRDGRVSVLHVGAHRGEHPPPFFPLLACKDLWRPFLRQVWSQMITDPQALVSPSEPPASAGGRGLILDRSTSAFLASSGVLIVAGGAVAAVNSAAPFGHGSWLAAYLVLVGGVSQVVLGAGRLALRAPRPNSGASAGAARAVESRQPHRSCRGARRCANAGDRGKRRAAVGAGAVRRRGERGATRGASPRGRLPGDRRWPGRERRRRERARRRRTRRLAVRTRCDVALRILSAGA